jgi:hypothetical protein
VLRLARLSKFQPNFLFLSPSLDRRTDVIGDIVSKYALQHSTRLIICFSVRITYSDENGKTSMPNAFRLKSSMTLNSLSVLQYSNWSCMKFMDQKSFTASDTFKASGFSHTKHLRDLIRKLSSNLLYMLYTLL